MEQRRHRRRITAAAEEEESARSIHDVPDDLLRVILLRLDSPLWHLRAACACKRWRRVVVAGGSDGSGRAFLRLAGSLHPPAVVGHYHERVVGLPTAFVPSSPPPAPIDAGRFSLDSLPVRIFAGAGWTVTTDWAVEDCHGGLVLLRKRSGRMPSFIVCDPLTHLAHWFRCISFPPVRGGGGRGDYPLADTFLLDGEDGEISLSNFRVLYRFSRDSLPQVFSTADGGNRRSMRRWTDDCSGNVAGRVDGSLYLSMSTGDLLTLDNGSLEFSKVNLPSRIDTSNHESTFTAAYKSTFTVVHGAAAGLDLTSPPRTWIIHAYGEQLELFRLARGTTGEWVLEHSIPKLSEATHGLPGVEKTKPKWVTVDVIATGTGTAVLSACDRGDRRWFFSVDVDTKELQVVPQEAYSRTRRAISYTLPWPQLLQACPLDPS